MLTAVFDALEAAAFAALLAISVYEDPFGAVEESPIRQSKTGLRHFSSRTVVSRVYLAR